MIIFWTPDGVWVGATLPAAPPVRSAKSRHFSMAKLTKLFGAGSDPAVINEESFLSGLNPDAMDEDFDGQLVF